MSKPALAREKILNAALKVVREKGFSATTVDDLCAAAGVTKGAFFHHFQSKEDLGVQAAQHWGDVTGAFFAEAPYHRHADPLDRLLGYLDFRREILRGRTAEYTCVAGTMVQETFDTSPAIRAACERTIFEHAANVTRDIELAKQRYVPRAEWSADGLSAHIQAVIQGSFILAKAKGDPAVADTSLSHLRRYVEMLFSSLDIKKGTA